MRHREVGDPVTCNLGACLEHEAVTACATGQAVGACSALDPVSAIAANKTVLAGAAQKNVCSGPSVQCVGPAAAANGVAKACAQIGIVPSSAGHVMGLGPDRIKDRVGIGIGTRRAAAHHSGNDLVHIARNTSGIGDVQARDRDDRGHVGDKPVRQRQITGRGVPGIAQRAQTDCINRAADSVVGEGVEEVVALQQHNTGVGLVARHRRVQMQDLGGLGAAGLFEEERHLVGGEPFELRRQIGVEVYACAGFGRGKLDVQGHGPSFLSAASVRTGTSARPGR